MTRSAGRRSLSLIAAVAVVLTLLSARLTLAHESRPAYLELTETAPGRFDVVWKVPVVGGGAPLAGDDTPHASDPTVAPPPGAPTSFPCGCPTPWAAGGFISVLPIHPVFPPGTRSLLPVRVERLPAAEIRRFTLATGRAGLEGRRLEVHGLAGTDVDVVVRVSLADGTVVSRVLRPGSPSFTLHAAEAGTAASGYFLLGVEHILLGFDHLLFVLCLLLLVRGVRRLVATITAFTLAHSVTLALATLGVLHVPSPPVEATIALSIVFLAAEIASRRQGAPGLAERKPWLVAMAFGLLHGLGFAGALAEVGLPPGEVPLALALFNIGVEAGQLAFVAVVLAAFALLTRTGIALSARWPRVAAYAIGTVAVFWTMSRVQFFG